MAGQNVSIGRGVLAAGLVLLAVVVFLAVLGSPVAAADAGNVTLYRAPDAAFEDAEDVEAAIAEGTVEPADEMVAGATLVVAVDSGRLSESIAAGNGTATERFLDARDGDATFRIAQTNPTPERARKVAPLGRENVTVHRLGTTTYVLVDTGALAFRYHGTENHPAKLRDGDRFAVTFGYGLDEQDTSGPEFDLYTTAAEFLTLDRYDPLPPEVVNRSVKVNVEPDAGPVVRLTLEDGRTITAPVEPVDWSGYPGVSIDLGGVEPGTDYTLELVHDGTVVDRYEGTVLEPRAQVANATLTEVESEVVVTRSGERVTETIDDHTAVDVTVTLSHGGQVLVLDETCERVGAAWVDPGVETRLSVPLRDHAEPIRGRNESEYGFIVRALRDDGTEKVRYPGPGAETAANVNASECRDATPRGPADSSDPPTRTEPQQGTSTPAETPSTQGGDGGTTGTGGGQETDAETATPGQRGFTVAVAIVALLAIALVRTRQQ